MIKEGKQDKTDETKIFLGQIPFYKDVWDATFKIISTKFYRFN